MTIALFANGQVSLVVQETVRIACHYSWYAREERVAVEKDGDQGVYPCANEKQSYQQQWNADQQRLARPDAGSPAPPGERSVRLLPVSSLVVQPLLPFPVI